MGTNFLKNQNRAFVFGANAFETPMGAMCGVKKFHKTGKGQ